VNVAVVLGFWVFDQKGGRKKRGGKKGKNSIYLICAGFSFSQGGKRKGRERIGGPASVEEKKKKGKGKKGD